MKPETSVRSLMEIFRANVLDILIKNDKPTKERYQFFDLHVHLPLPKIEEVPEFLKRLTTQVDGATLADYGRVQSGIETYDNIVGILEEYTPKNFSVNNKGLVTVIKELETEKESILFRSEEIDGTNQGLDITIVGIKDWIPNPYKKFNYDAREIADRGRAQGALTYLEHFCALESKGILPWIVEEYKNQEKRKELFEVFDHVDAVEIFNGFCMIWMPPQNILSLELVDEYNALRGTKKPVLAGSDVHLGLKSVGTAGILIPSLDSKLTDREIIEQLKDNIKNRPIYHKKDYNGLNSFISQRRRLKKERERIKRLASA